MVNFFVAVALIVAGASVQRGNSPRASPQNPELTWPAAFSGQVAAVEWTNRSFEATGVQIRVSVPSTWTANSPTPLGSFNAIDRANGLRLEIAETQPSSFALDKPVTGEQLAGSIRTMQTASPAGYVIEKAGQVRIGDRLWLWHESTIPAFDAATVPGYKDRLNEVPYASARGWSFVATPGSQLVRVYFTVLFPKDASEAQIASRTAEAGAVFAEVLRRIDFAGANSR